MLNPRTSLGNKSDVNWILLKLSPKLVVITTSLGLNFKRIQFTSDLLPSDVLGFNILSDDKLKFQKGPIFTNIVLADELNRGSPKAQSAFLEAMEEKNVTIAVSYTHLTLPTSR